MSFGYTTINGQRVEAHVAADFNALNNEFHAITGEWLVISSGTRTDDEQRYLYNGWIAGLPGFNLAAKPNTSNHQESGPIGPRALDLRDTGSNAGVLTIGSYRSNVLVQIAPKHNFKNAGHFFNPREAWHYEWTGNFSSGGNTYEPSIPIDDQVRLQQNFLNIARGEKLETDGRLGDLTIAAIKRYQEFLRGYGYTGDIDGRWGVGTQSAHAKYYAEWEAAQNGTGGIPAFPLPHGQWFGPEAGGDQSISGWHSDPLGHPGLKQFQQRMKDRGWDIIVDGLYGQKGDTEPRGNTADVVGAFQTQKGLVVDKKIGPNTWVAAWNSPVTPGTDPVPDGTNPSTTPIPVPIPDPTPTTDAEREKAATPSLVQPTVADFPGWIRFEEKWDATDFVNKPTLNADAAVYYKRAYSPIELHTHWWGEPGKAGTHDGNVQYISSTADLSVNFVTSAGRITAMVPINKIALTTGSRNPEAWKAENDPLITTSVDDLGYRTLGYLVYIVEKLNPILCAEPIRLHKEVLPGTTTCSNIDTAKVRRFAEQFRTGQIDPATGLPPVVTPDPEPEPNPEDEYVKPSTLTEISEAYRTLGDALEKLPNE